MVKKYGITLIILMVAIVIIAIISAVTVVSVSDTISETNLKTFAMELYNLQRLVDSYKMKNNGKLDFTTYTVKAEDYTGKLKAVLEAEDNPQRDEIIFYLLDADALSKLAAENLIYGNQKYDETDIYAVSGTSGRVYYLYGFESKEEKHYYLTAELSNYLADKLDLTIDKADVVFVPSTIYKLPQAVSVKVKVPIVADRTTINITTDKSGIAISNYVEENGYYVYTVNTGNVDGNYTINVSYTAFSKPITATYYAERYMRSICYALF